MTGAGNLVVHLMAKTKQFETGMRRSAQHTNALGHRVNKLSMQQRAMARATSIASSALMKMAVVLGPALVVQRMISYTSTTLNAIEETGRLADRLGLATEKLQGLQYAARRSGSSSEQMADAVEKMQKRLGDAARGTGEARNAVADLGLSLHDLLSVRPDVQMGMIADAMQGIESPAERASVASAIFGRSNTELINVLADGSAGLREMQREAEALGMTLNNSAVEATKAANDEVERLSSMLSGAGMKSVAGWAQMLDGLTDSLGGLEGALDRVTVSGIDMLSRLGHLPGQLQGIMQFIQSGGREFSFSTGGFSGTTNVPSSMPAVTPPPILEPPSNGIDAATISAVNSILDAPTFRHSFGDVLSEGAQGFLSELNQWAETKSQLDPLGEQLARSLETPVEAFMRRFSELEKMAEFGAITNDTHIRALERLRDEYAPDAEMDGPTRYAGAMHRGGREAYSTMLASMGQGRDEPQKKMAKDTAAIKEILAESNRRIGQLVEREEVDIPPT